jgi:hypothetical protein
VDRFPQVIDNVYSMILVIGDETLKLPEHTGWLPAASPEEPPAEETEEPQAPAEPEDPDWPPDAELPVEPTPAAETMEAEEPPAGAPEESGEPETAGENAPDEVTNEESNEAEQGDTEKTEG